MGVACVKVCVACIKMYVASAVSVYTDIHAGGMHVASYTVTDNMIFMGVTAYAYITGMYYS